jgi:hypothetical protein
MELRLYRIFSVPAIALLVAAALFTFANTASAQEFTAEADLSGSEEVPSVSTDTTGDFTMEFDEDGDNMEFSLSVFDGNEITAAHLHCAEDGENGPVVVTLFEDDDGTDVNGSLASGSIDESDIEDANCNSTIGMDIESLSDLADAIDAGDIYVNAHSEAYPNGVARGQLEMSDQNGNDDNDDDEDDDRNNDDHKNKHDDGKDKKYDNDKKDRNIDYRGEKNYNNDEDDECRVDDKDWNKDSSRNNSYSSQNNWWNNDDDEKNWENNDDRWMKDDCKDKDNDRNKHDDKDKNDDKYSRDDRNKDDRGHKDWDKDNSDDRWNKDENDDDKWSKGDDDDDKDWEKDRGDNDDDKWSKDDDEDNDKDWGFGSVKAKIGAKVNLW